MWNIIDANRFIWRGFDVRMNGLRVWEMILGVCMSGKKRSR